LGKKKKKKTGSKPVCEILSQKTLHKNRAGGMAQGEGHEFKPQYHKKRIKKILAYIISPLHSVAHFTTLVFGFLGNV
jgi:hypothetical protein